MSTLFPIPKFKPVNAAGNLIPGGFLYSWEAGTTTPKVTQKGKSGANNTNPVVLDSDGEADVWLDGAFKLELRLADDATVVWTVDNIDQFDQLDWTGLTATIAMLNSTDSSALFKTATYSVAVTDWGKTILCTPTPSTPLDINLPASASITNGFHVTVKNISTNDAETRVVQPGGTTMEGLTSDYRLRGFNDVATFLFDGTNWKVLGPDRRRALTRNITGADTITGTFDRNLVTLQGGASSYNVAFSAVSAEMGYGFEVTFLLQSTSGGFVVINPPAGRTIDGNANLVLDTVGHAVTLWMDAIGDLITIQNRTPDVSLVPPGTILDFGGLLANIPAGYLNCDGAAVSRTTYSDLFAAVSTTWGVGDGSTTFNLPNFRDRTAVGAGTSYTVGQLFGSATHTLVKAEVPPHTHIVSVKNDATDTHGVGSTMNIANGFANITSDDGSSGGLGGGAHNNLQPSAGVLKMIKI